MVGFGGLLFDDLAAVGAAAAHQTGFGAGGLTDDRVVGDGMPGGGDDIVDRLAAARARALHPTRLRARRLDAGALALVMAERFGLLGLDELAAARALFKRAAALRAGGVE